MGTESPPLGSDTLQEVDIRAELEDTLLRDACLLMGRGPQTLGVKRVLLVQGGWLAPPHTLRLGCSAGVLL